MSLANIVDRRKNSRYNVEVDVVFEPSWHDNSSEGATQFMHDDEQLLTIDSMDDTTVEEAVKKCDDWDLPVTLYLYDKGADPMGVIGDDESFVDTIVIESTENGE